MARMIAVKRQLFFVLAGVLIAALGAPVEAQSHAAVQPQPAGDSQSAVLRSETTLVVVPALVRDKKGDPVFTLNASDFALVDDGITQKLTLEESSVNQPLALAVVVEIGGAGAREFDKLGPLAPMLDSIVGGVPHQVAVIAFDNQPNLVQDFTSDTDRATRAVARLTADCRRRHYLDACEQKSSATHLGNGDNGAAILDSLNYAVDLLDLLPSSYRRAILLVSESADRGSKTTIDRAVRTLSDTNTIIYAVEFSTAKSEAAHYANRELPIQIEPGAGLAFGNPHPNPPRGCMGKETDPDPDLTNNNLAKLYDCAGELAPPLALAKMAAIAAHDALLTNVPETVARLTGGESFKLTNARSLEAALAQVSNDIPNRYVLTYHPRSPRPGFHAISLTLPNHANLRMNARTSYWVSTDSSPTQ